MRFLTKLLSLVVLALFSSLPAAAADADRSFAVVEVRIFDGHSVIPSGSVVVVDGKIAAVGTDIEIPNGIETYKGDGGTLLPGLIDGHVHTWGDALTRALVFGVTTEFDQFSSAHMAQTLRAQQAAGEADSRADLFSAGTLATAPGGHGTQFGMAIPTLTQPSDANQWVADRVTEGSDWIKIVAEDGSAHGLDLPSLDDETIAALIAAAHDHGKLAVVHVSRIERARAAISNGADGLVHTFGDVPADDDFVRLMTEKKAFIIPTLTVIESTTGVASGAVLVDDEHFGAYLRRDEITGLERAFPVREGSRRSLEYASATVAKLHAAGVPIVAGSDAPNPGTAHGPSLHRELELLVAAGLTPVQALEAATATAAKSFGLEDRGRIAAGLRADLVLVAGDPTSDILASRDISKVWKGGVAAERLKADRSTATVKPTAPSGGGVISTFEDGTMAVSMGAGWMDSTDSIAGGKSTVETEIVDRPDAESQGDGEPNTKALAITGSINEGFMAPWAGAMFSPGAGTFEPIDLRATPLLTFSARGDGGTFRVLIFAQALGMMPSEKTFVAGEAWQHHEMPLTDFRGTDASDIMAVFFGAGAKMGDFELMIDDVALLPAKAD